MVVQPPRIQVTSILKLNGIIPVRKGALREGYSIHCPATLRCGGQWHMCNHNGHPQKFPFQFCVIVGWDTNRETGFNGIKASKLGRKRIVFPTATIIYCTRYTCNMATCCMDTSVRQRVIPVEVERNLSPMVTEPRILKGRGVRRWLVEGRVSRAQGRYLWSHRLDFVIPSKRKSQWRIVTGIVLRGSPLSFNPRASPASQTHQQHTNPWIPPLQTYVAYA